MTRWVESRLPVTGVDEKERIVTFSKRSVFELAPGDLYYVEGAFEFLDEPGEWYLDPAGGTLYYLPRSGERLAEIQAIAPVLAQVLRFEGRPEAGQFVERVVLRGLTFSHTEWCFPTGFQSGKNKPSISPAPQAEVGGFGQAAVGVPGAVWGEGLRDCVFENCRFTAPRQLRPGIGARLPGNRIVRCEFSDLGAGGLKIGETTHSRPAAEQTGGNEISDCHIHDGGKMFHSAIGIWIGQSPGNRIAHNLIHDFYYTGISIGWTWGYGPALATNNTVDVQSRPSHRREVGRRRADPERHGRHLHAGQAAGHGRSATTCGTTSRASATAAGASTSTKAAAASWPRTTSSIAPRMAAFTSTTARPTSSATTSSPSRATTRFSAPAPKPHLSFTFVTNIVYFDSGNLLGGDWSGDNY